MNGKSGWFPYHQQVFVFIDDIQPGSDRLVLFCFTWQGHIPAWLVFRLFHAVIKKILAQAVRFFNLYRLSVIITIMIISYAFSGTLDFLRIRNFPGIYGYLGFADFLCSASW